MNEAGTNFALYFLKIYQKIFIYSIACWIERNCFGDRRFLKPNNINMPEYNTWATRIFL